MEFIIYSRQDCHLCDVMKDELEAMAGFKTETIKLVDIDNDPALKKRFNDQIPVLFVDDVEICRHRLSKKRLLRFLDSE